MIYHINNKILKNNMLRKLKIYHIKFSLTHIYICVLIITCIYLKYEVVVLKTLDKY